MDKWYRKLGGIFKSSNIEQSGEKEARKWEGNEKKEETLYDQSMEGGFTEDEMYIIENERKSRVDLENMTDADYFPAYIGYDELWEQMRKEDMATFQKPTMVPENLPTEPTPNQFKDLASYRKALHSYEEQLQELLDPTMTEQEAFENEDILGNALRKRVADKKLREEKVQQTKKDAESYFNSMKDLAPEYSPQEFRLMTRAYEYKKFIEGGVKGEVPRPKFENGNDLSTKQIIETLAKYQLSRNKQNDFSPAEIELAKSCETWFETAVQKTPLMSGGKELDNKQIEELAKEYGDLKKNNPLEFAKTELSSIGERQVEKGTWLKKNLVWEENVHVGKKQWVALEKDPATQRVLAKYISFTNPAAIVPNGKQGTFYYEVDKKIPNSPLIFVDLKLPRVPKVEEKPAKKSKSPEKKSTGGANTGSNSKTTKKVA